METEQRFVGEALDQRVVGEVRFGAVNPERAWEVGPGFAEYTTLDGAGIADGAIPPERGIANTQERLRVLYGTAASLAVTRGASGGTVATLRVPYRVPPTEDDDVR